MKNTMTIDSNNTSNNNEQVSESVSYRDGYYFPFQQGEHLIEVKASAKSGRESIYVDGKLVSEFRNWGTSSCTSIKVGKETYEIEVKMAKILSGEVHCTLIKDSTHVETQKLALKKRYQFRGKRVFFYLPLAGFIGGALGAAITETLIALF